MLHKSLSERERILQKPKHRPYGALIGVSVGPNRGHTKSFFSIEEKATLLVNEDLVITATHNGRLSERTGRAEWNLKIDGFSTAGEAEQAGLRFAAAILWTSISMGTPKFKLTYSTPLPCEVYQRTKGGGQLGEANIVLGYKASTALEALSDFFNGRNEIDRRLLLAMELFCGSQFETTARASFIEMVSSLEPLAEQERYTRNPEYGKKIEALIQAAREQVRQLEGLPETVQNSLEGRIGDLGRESVRQAYLRLVRPHLTEQEVKAVDDAYALRSDMLHDGGTSPDLPEISRIVEQIYRKVFAGLIGMPLVKPPVYP